MNRQQRRQAERRKGPGMTHADVIAKRKMMLWLYGIKIREV